VHRASCIAHRASRIAHRASCIAHRRKVLGRSIAPAFYAIPRCGGPPTFTGCIAVIPQSCHDPLKIYE
jgi:hypothetical protein